MVTKKQTICCPTCNKSGTWTENNAFRPFCSHRCKLIDLGDWADEKHRVAGESVNLDELSKDQNNHE